MKILPIKHNHFNKNIKFSGECGHDEHARTINTRMISLSNFFQESDTHPIWMQLKFHDNGKISDIEIKYKNGKHASGTIKESYDENGKNLNYCA